MATGVIDIPSNVIGFDTGDLVPDATDFLPDAPTFDFNFEGGEQFGMILALTMIVIGLLFSFVGTRTFKVTIFVFALIIGAGFGYFIVRLFSDSAKAALITAGIMGILAGGAVLKLYYLAIFSMGAGVGLIVWLVFKALFPTLFAETVMYLILAGLILFLGLVGLKMEKFWLMIGTPIIGAFLTFQGIDSFIPGTKVLGNSTIKFNVLDLIVNANQGCEDAACYAIYSIVIFWSLLGFFVQYKYTSEYAKEKRLETDAKEGKKEKKKAKRRRKRRKKKRRRSS